MSYALTTLHGTAEWEALTDTQRVALSRTEAVNFYSLNVHGIRELLTEVVGRIYTKPFADTSEFLDHFIGEENDHMWFFATFCLRYGGKLYTAPPALPSSMAADLSATAQELLVFARILIFEEIVDYFNQHMGSDSDLPPIVQDTGRMTDADHAWADRLGPGLVEADVARLLQRPAAGVAGDPGLLRLTNRDSQIVYPVLQFVPGGLPLPHLAEILRLLAGPLLPLTIASWLVGPQSDLGGRTPRQALLDGDATRVLELAQQTAAAAA